MKYIVNINLWDVYGIYQVRVLKNMLRRQICFILYAQILLETELATEYQWCK